MIRPPLPDLSGAVVLLPQSYLPIPQGRRPLEFLSLDGFLLLAGKGGHLSLHALEIGWCRHAGDPQSRRRLVHQVNGLVGEKAVGNILHRKLHRRLQSLIGDLHFVVCLVPRTEPRKDAQGLLLGGLPHRHRLEPPLQSRVLLNVETVFLHRGCTNDADLPP